VGEGGWGGLSAGFSFSFDSFSPFFLFSLSVFFLFSLCFFLFSLSISPSLLFFSIARAFKTENK